MKYKKEIPFSFSFLTSSLLPVPLSSPSPFLYSPILSDIPLSSLFPSDQEIQNPHNSHSQPQTQPAGLHSQSDPDQWGFFSPEQHDVCEPRL